MHRTQEHGMNKACKNKFKTPMEIDIHRNTSQLCLRYDIASL